MLTAFEIDGQRFEAIRIHKRPRPNDKSNPILSAVWQSNCLACRSTFQFEKQTRAFVPAFSAVRRCLPCRSKAKGRIGLKQHAEFSQNGSPIPPTLPRVWVHDGPDPNDLSRKKTGRKHVIPAGNGLSMARTDRKPTPKAKGPPPAGHFRD